jgi:hypothetical protein
MAMIWPTMCRVWELNNPRVNKLSTLSQTSTTKMKIAILTSGGDSAGMNAAVRSIVKCGILK